MSIELSTIVFTIINFCVLMAVLHFLLFKPTLKNIHERRRKINRSVAIKTNSAEKLEEQNRLISERIDLSRKSESDAFRATVEKADAEILADKKRFEEGEDIRIEQIKKALEKEREKMEGDLEGYLHEFAAALADRLVSKDY
ncbi:MAG: hypothetical protein WCR95_00480 [Eubacteriales bacterium]